jgi:hypothetical protein
MFDVDTRLRLATFNEDERKLRMYEDESGRGQTRPDELAVREMGYMAMDGLVSREALDDVMAGMVEAGELDRPVDDVLQDAASLDAYQQLVDRGVLDRSAVARWRGASA